MSTQPRTITLHGDPLTLLGNVPKIGEPAPNFCVTGVEMQDIELENFKNEVLVVGSIPSIDTPVCARETKRLSHDLTEMTGNPTILMLSMDLPFAFKRWCGSEGVDNIIGASEFKYRSFGTAYGTQIEELNLLTRAAFVIDQAGVLQYAEYVPEVSSEPDYDGIMSTVKRLLQ